MQIIETEFGGEDSPLQALAPAMAAAARRVVATYAPDIKAALYATGLAKLFVLELGPLLTVRVGCKSRKSLARLYRIVSK